MKVSFDHKHVSSYKEIYHECKRTQECAESVVPDTQEDIGKIVSVQSCVLLRSKDITGRGALITGEAQAVLVYITENEQTVSVLKISKSFSLDYDLGEMDGEDQAQILLQILNCEARVINPRKVSVVFDIAGELSCYRKEDLPVAPVFDGMEDIVLHAKYEKTNLMRISAVCEKPFTISEQFIFPAGKPEPKELICQKVEFETNECQMVGSKLVIKGTLNLSAYYFSESVPYPVKADFSAPFSQILDTGIESMDSCSVYAMLSGVYCELVSTMNGEKVLEAEIHTVLQTTLSVNQEVSYLSDVYSNLMPAVCEIQRDETDMLTGPQQTKLIADERVLLPEDCTDVLCVFTGLNQAGIEGDKIAAVITMDVLYRCKNNSLSSVRRLIGLSNECSKKPDRLLSLHLNDIYLRPDGASIDVHLAADVKFFCCEKLSIDRVCAITLDEEHPNHFAAFPAFTLVRTETETIWELAKMHHSSVEAIRHANEMENVEAGMLLLIPKSI